MYDDYDDDDNDNDNDNILVRQTNTNKIHLSLNKDERALISEWSGVDGWDGWIMIMWQRNRWANMVDCLEVKSVTLYCIYFVCLFVSMNLNKTNDWLNNCMGEEERVFVSMVSEWHIFCFVYLIWEYLNPIRRNLFRIRSASCKTARLKRKYFKFEKKIFFLL